MFYRWKKLSYRKEILHKSKANFLISHLTMVKKMYLELMKKIKNWTGKMILATNRVYRFCCFFFFWGRSFVMTDRYIRHTPTTDDPCLPSHIQYRSQVSWLLWQKSLSLSLSLSLSTHTITNRGKFLYSEICYTKLQAAMMVHLVQDLLRLHQISTAPPEPSHETRWMSHVTLNRKQLILLSNI